mmetsp:Transcript_35204/g.59760  ORF Transcript_35204/g.59760 Transcript_35204/m.59760 type:complete len:113 (+) Transcript_35204:424-762(+)
MFFHCFQFDSSKLCHPSCTLHWLYQPMEIFQAPSQMNKTGAYKSFATTVKIHIYALAVVISRQNASKMGKLLTLTASGLKPFSVAILTAPHDGRHHGLNSKYKNFDTQYHAL